MRAGYQVMQDPDAYQLAGLRIWNVVTKSPMTLCSVHVNFTMKLQVQIHDTFFLFGVRSTCRGVLCSAMDGDEESTSLRGLRLKWQKLSHGIPLMLSLMKNMWMAILM